MLSVFKCQFSWTVWRRTGESNPSGCKQPSNASQACPVPTPGVSSEAAPATRWLYQTFRMDLCDIHHNHQIPFLIWEADKCLVVNAEGRAREIAPLSFLRESRFSRGVKIPTLRKPRRAGQPAAYRRSRTARRTQQLMDRDTAQRHAPQQSRTGAGCQMSDTYLLHLHAEGAKCFLLTSPFIEPP